VSPAVPALRTTCRGAGWLTIAVALVVLVGGWMLDVERLRNIVPGTVGMKSLTAVGLIAAAVALLALIDPATARRTLLARLAAGFTAALGLAVLGEYLLGWSLGIDELLFSDDPGRAAAVAYPGRFAPTTAAGFVLAGLALATLDARPWRAWRISELAAIPLACMGVLTIVGYLYAIPAFYGPASAAKMALNTGVCFVALSAGILLARPRNRLVALATTEDPGGIMLRRLLPLAVVIPLALGWARLRAADAGLFGDRAGTWWLSAVTIVVLSVLIVRVASHLSRAAHERGVLEAELHRLANHDALTGLFNRHRFDEELAAAAGRLARGGAPCSLIVLDLDRLKRVNDALGHGAGDDLLQAIGALLRRRLRAGDAGARIGGDEFAILLGGDVHAASVLAEHVRASIAGLRVATPRGEAWTTVSIGIAALAPGQPPEHALRFADEAMYRGKRDGGDGIVVDEPPLPAQPAPA
jgi:diguanylate cyclase (GGDEF)-like protein